MVHNISGIGSSRVDGGAQDFFCHSNDLDLWQSGGVAVTGDFDVPVASDSYFVSGVDFENIVGHNNLNVVNVDTCDGRVGSPGAPGAPAPYLVRDVSVNNVDARDGDGSGYPELCNEGMRFDGVTGLRVTNSTFKRLGDCHVNGGTAGIILVAVDGVTFANNVISDVPNTGSNDQTGIDNELYVNGVTLKNNLIARNAGPGVEYLSLRSGIADYNTNHVVAGNTFFGNGGGSLYRLNPGGAPFTGSITNNLVADDVFVSPPTDFHSLVPDNANNVQADNTVVPSYSADQFGSDQGGSGWRYRTGDDAGDPGSWKDAQFTAGDHISGVWSDGGPHKLAAFEQTAGTERVWTAPQSGTLAIRSLAFKTKANGQAVTASILHNGSSIASARLDADDVEGKNVGGEVAVAAGDTIEFVLAGVSSADDWTSWSPSLMYEAKPSTSSGGLKNGSFESPYVGGYQYAPADNSWSFSPRSTAAGDGIVANGSAFGNPNATQGGQAAFIQSQGAIAQTVTDLVPGVPYSVSFDIARRGGETQTVQILWDGKLIDSVSPTASSYTRYASPNFLATAGEHTLTLRGTASTDQSAFIDNVQLALMPEPSADVAFADPSFEQARVTGIAYGATGSPWSFPPSANGSGDGIAANGSPFGQANAPDGTQAGFVQRQGTFGQTVNGFLAGKTYMIVLQATQRPGNGQSIDVVVDGSKVSTITPSGSAWSQYVSSPFTPGGGTHVIAFKGTSPDDETAFIDAVQFADVDTVPGAPQEVATTLTGDHTVAVSWAPPSSDGGKAITGYTAYLSGTDTVACTATAAENGCSITNLPFSTTVSVEVVAMNSLGESGRSMATTPLTTPEVQSNDGATNAPGVAILSTDNGWDTGLQDGSFTVSMNLWYGTNGSLFTLYQNGKPVGSKRLTMSTPNAQSAAFDITGLPNGTYVFTGKLVNSHGSTEAKPVTVNVTDANPGKPVLSQDNWDLDGNYVITADMWWGTNATSYRFIEDGREISKGDLTAKTPAAQHVQLKVSGRTLGTHKYVVEFSNAAGTTASEPILVTVSK
ncbi:fibronectin type III domain-containing protein [Leifsonia sp. NPDC014704]|uniref:fibronectin type III domain-containing protein n=1 Tax=Leifsonia sp. NPDC014704 TaxID=3364123 RepID=UPI0036F47249